MSTGITPSNKSFEELHHAVLDLIMRNPEISDQNLRLKINSLYQLTEK